MYFSYVVWTVEDVEAAQMRCDPMLNIVKHYHIVILNISTLPSLLAFQDDNINLREEVEGLHRKFEALKRFAAQKKIRLPAEFEQYQ